MKRWLEPLLFVLSATLIFGACEAADRPIPCALDADCDPGQACLEGVCRDVDCSSSADCPDGEICVAHECTPASSCTTDGQCPVGSICVSGLCAAGCRVDGDCPTALRCAPSLGANGSCVACVQDGDCEGGAACIGNQCRSDCQGPSDCPDSYCEPVSGTCVECLQDGHCPDGALCQDNLCRAGCRQDAGCPAGQICEAELCRPGCRADVDCESGFCDPASWLCSQAECQSQDDCPLGHLCRQGACEPGCLSNRDCPDGLTCLPDEGQQGVCAECLSNQDCPQGLRCVSFRCSDACQQDADCATGYCHPQAEVCVDCYQDDQCAAGEICESSACQAGCRQDEQCGQGQICQGLVCVNGCRDDANCPGDQICAQSLCRPGCRLDSDCNNGTCDTTTWQCVGFECESDDQCQLGQLCIDRLCVSGCNLDRDCPVGQVCDPAGGENGICLQCIDDLDCSDPDYPSCQNHVCEPECRDNQQCPADQACVDLHCQDLPDECVMRVEPAQSVDYGAVPIGSTIARAFLLSNQGAQPCHIESIEVRQGMLFSGDFHLGTIPQAPIELGPAGQLSVDVNFAPGFEGQHVSTFWVVTDDPELLIGATDLFYCGGIFGSVTPGSACVPLFGEGVVMDVQAVPAAVSFGQVSVGCSSDDQTVRFYNLGGAVTLESIMLEQAYDPTFAITDAPGLPLSVPADGQFGIDLRFSPLASGPRENTLILQFANLPPLEVPLSGLGVLVQQQTDSFHLPADVLVDVLWVVDNSGSMGEEQEALATNFGAFIAWAETAGVNYHVGVVSTEVNEAETGQGSPPRDIIPGVLVHAPSRPRYITPSTTNPEAAFADNVRLGTCCSDEQEAGLQASWMALSPPLLHDQNANGGFIRPEAKLYVIYVSDETDQSLGPVEFFVDYFSTLKGGSERVTLSAVCGNLPDGCEGVMGTAMGAPRYHQARQSTDGLFQSICQSDWSGMMQALGEDAFEPQRLFRLSRLAVQSSIAVSVDGWSVDEASSAYAPDGWTYLPGDNAIWFGDQVVPAAGLDVIIDYTSLCL